MILAYTFEEARIQCDATELCSQVILISSLTNFSLLVKYFTKPAKLKNCIEKAIKDQAYLANQAY